MSGKGDTRNVESRGGRAVGSSELVARADAEHTAAVPATPDQAQGGAGHAELSRTALARVGAAVAAHDETKVEWIGRYRLVEIIGEGGMGEVWRAEQEHPIRRTVALKLIKPGMDTREVVARFESERQALALMDHPNIAKVLDAGTSEVGRPYFVMEHVPGELITGFCDRQRYTIRQRLELFLQACDAIRHAHQRAIIHRDLKPSNVLVMLEDGKPLVRVIDFGVAKAVGVPLPERTLLTEQGRFVGTPEYMSPEQAEMSLPADVDTRSDIYSLGVLLYELLAGSPPFDPKVLRSGGLSEILRIIREDEPPRPSTRVRGLGEEAARRIADCRQTRPEDLRRELRVELEWIALKAMRKERSQRYASAIELAQDVRNYLEQQPLMAGPESTLYRLRKFVRRRRLEVLAASLVSVSLLAGMIGTYTFAVRESRRAEETRKVALFQEQMLGDLDVHRMGLRLREDLLAEAEQNWRFSGHAEPEVARRRAEVERLLSGANFTNPAIGSLVRNVLDPAVETLDKRFSGPPLVKAQLLQNLADILRNLTRLERATGPQGEALEIRQRLLTKDHPDLLASMHSMGMLLAAKGKWREAEPYARDSLAGRQRALGADDRLTLRSKALLAEVLQRRGALRDAEPLRRQAMDGFRRLFGEADPDTLDATLRYGQVMLWRYRLHDAQRYLDEAISGMRQSYGEDDARTLKAQLTLGNLRRLQGDLAEARRLSIVAYEGSRAAGGDHHRDTLYAVLRIGATMRMQRDFQGARLQLVRAVDGFRQTLGDAHFDTLNAMHELGVLLHLEGDLSGAEDCLRRALKGFADPLAGNEEQALWVTLDMALLRQTQGDWAEARRLLASLFDDACRGRVEPWAAARLVSHLGPHLVRSGRYEEAEGPLLKAQRLLKETGQEHCDRMRAVVGSLISVYTEIERPDEAGRWRAELASLRPVIPPTTVPATGD